MEEKGSYGCVTFTEYNAIKKFNEFSIFYNELFYLSLFQNENVSKILSANSKELTISMVKYDGSIYHLMKEIRYAERIKLAEEIIKQVLPAIEALHRKGVSHRDITTCNIFYRKKGNYYEFVLGDFSLATVLDEWKFYKDSIYEDPCKECSNRSTDIWMFGATIWEFITKSRSPLYQGYYKDNYLDFHNIYDLKLEHSLYNTLSSFMVIDGNKRSICAIIKPLYTPFPYWRRNDIIVQMVNRGIFPEIAHDIWKSACDIGYSGILEFRKINANSIIRALG